MPVHAVLLVPVKIAEQGVEGVASVIFDLLLQRAQDWMPLQSTGQGKGQREFASDTGGSRVGKHKAQNQSNYKRERGMSKPLGMQ